MALANVWVALAPLACPCPSHLNPEEPKAPPQPPTRVSPLLPVPAFAPLAVQSDAWAVPSVTKSPPEPPIVDECRVLLAVAGAVVGSYLPSKQLASRQRRFRS